MRCETARVLERVIRARRVRLDYLKKAIAIFALHIGLGLIDSSIKYSKDRVCRRLVCNLNPVTLNLIMDLATLKVDKPR